MKQLFTALLLATMLLLVQQESFAQPIHGVTLRYVWYNYDNANPAWDNWTDIFSVAIPRGVEVGYNRRLDKKVNGRATGGTVGRRGPEGSGNRRPVGMGPVSYTHLTLPTSDLV